jgi:purine-binding chemotaxis protein CheW
MNATMPANPAQRYVVFHLSHQAYMLPTQAVDEIVPMVELSRPPCAPSMLAGFLNFGGELLAVIDLRRLFGLPVCEPRLYTPLIVLKCESPRIALQVDEVTQIIGESNSKLMPIGDRCCLNDAAAAMVEVADGTALLLSPARLLLEAERCRLAELQQLEHDRLKSLQEVIPCS